MAKSLAHAALDAAFAYVADRADALALCEGAPASFTAANTAKSGGGVGLGSIAMATGLGNGDYSVSAGDISGRKLTIAEQQGVSVSETGLADHVALIDTTNQALLLVTSLASALTVTAGGSVTIESFDDEIQDPT